MYKNPMTPINKALQELERQEYEHEQVMKRWLYGALEACADTDLDRVDGHIKQALQELQELRGCMNAIMVMEEAVASARDTKRAKKSRPKKRTR